jgi:hypothetical protein
MNDGHAFVWTHGVWRRLMSEDAMEWKGWRRDFCMIRLYLQGRFLIHLSLVKQNIEVWTVEDFPLKFNSAVQADMSSLSSI